jgi:hypothetical protein
MAFIGLRAESSAGRVYFFAGFYARRNGFL